MIKFFRKLRQIKLREGKIGSYLTYAIGEIVLVVIGILIALQFNTFHINHLNKKNEQYYLNQMKNDLVSDSLYLYKVSVNLEERLPVIQTFLAELHQENNQESFITATRKYINSIFVPLFFVSNNATYNEMQSSAKLGIIGDKELRKRIVALYNHLEITRNIFSVNYEFMQPVDAELISGLGFAKYQKNQQDLFAPYITDEELYQLKRLKVELESNAANWNWTVVDMKPVVDSQMEELRDVISRINNYLL